jgi:hypothetical protein
MQILDNGLSIKNGNFQYAWFKIQKDMEVTYRCVALRELLIIPVSVREDYDLLGKQWGALRGLHNAGVSFVYTAMGIYRPEHIGIVQYYGAAGEGISEETAATKAMLGVSSVTAVLANYPQSKLGAPNPDWLKWYLEFITANGENIAAILGHPDPREGRKGSSDDGNVGDDSDSDLAEEQNEILFRGLSKLSQNFVFQVLAEHIQRPFMTKALIKISEIASNVASRRKGSIGFGFNLGIPLMAAINQSMQSGASAGQGTSHSTQDGVSQGWGNTHGVGQAHSEGVSHTTGTSESWGESKGASHGTSHSDGTSHSVGSSHTVSESSGSGHGSSSSSGWSGPQGGGLGDIASGVMNGDMPSLTNLGNSLGVNVSGDGWGVSRPGMTASGSSGSSSFSSHSSGVSDSVMQSDSTMKSDSTMESQSEGTMHSVSRMSSTSRSSTDTNSENWGESQNWGQSHANGQSVSETLARSAAHGIGTGFSTGLLPGISINRSWQTEDDVAERVADILRRLESVANQASVEGGFMANAWLFTDSEQGALAADALIPQAFHGPNVPTPVMTIRPEKEDVENLRAHAFSFTPWTEKDADDPLDGLLWTKYATLLTAGQLAAYTAPGLYEEGSASTTMAEIPQGIAFYPTMPGDAVIGHQYSPETAELTTAQVRLSLDNLMHTMAAGDTGFGKSVAMIRMAYETTLRWKLRTVVLDFGAGWRALLNAPGLEGHVNILQLWPDAVRPMRWNPLQIGRNIAPETQWRAFADVFGGIAALGVKRQKQELLEALRTLYVEHGVLVDDPVVREAETTNSISHAEAIAIGSKSGTKIQDLTPKEKQALAVHRSASIGLGDLYKKIQAKLKEVPQRDTMLQGVLEGIIFRLNPLVQGSAALQFAPGPDTIPVEDLSKPWGITIIEGGMFLDDFGKAFLLGWTGWHLYMDMVARRVHEVSMDEPILQIFYEEANKIFVKNGGNSEDESGGVSATQRFADMFRDARKYKSRLHVITQAPHLLADDIVSSCSNILVGFIKDSKDKDIVMSALARSEKGFRDEEWRRFVDDIPIGMTVGRFPYTHNRAMQRPFLFRPLMLDVPEPTDAEIAQKLGSIKL